MQATDRLEKIREQWTIFSSIHDKKKNAPSGARCYIVYISVKYFLPKVRKYVLVCVLEVTVFNKLIIPSSLQVRILLH